MGANKSPHEMGREAGEAIANAIADNLEAVILRLADSIATMQAEQAEIRDLLDELTKRMEVAEGNNAGLQAWAAEHGRR